MLSKADEEQLQRVCGNEETLVAARRLVPLAKARTKQGSGHHLVELTAGLPAICAYLVSRQLNNNDVTLDNARHASCLRANDFKKALRTVSGVLQSELSPRKGKKEISYDVLHEKYNVGQPFANFSNFLHEAERALVHLDARHQADSPDIRCAIFFWVKDLPTLDEFAQDNSMLSKRLAPTIKLLTDKCTTLKTKLIETARNSSRPSSPTKSLLQPSTPRTPRRSPQKPLRDLPTRESVRKQRLAQTAVPDAPKISEDVATSDPDMASPETPAKKRKFDASSPTPSAKRQAIFPPVTPSVSHIVRGASPTKAKVDATPAVPSPLRRSARFVLQQEVDASMEVDDEEEQIPAGIKRSLEAEFAKIGEDVDEGMRAEEYSAHRRFRPVYQDLRQWFARDARVVRMWKEASGVQ